MDDKLPSATPSAHCDSLGPIELESDKHSVGNDQSLSNLRALGTIAFCTATAAITIASSISVNILVPILQHDLSISASDSQWIYSGYPLGFGSCLLLLARLADTYGHKIFIQGGTALVGSAALGCALSRNHIQLSIFRILEGVGAAAILPALIGVLGTHLERGSVLHRVGFSSFAAGGPLGGAIGLLIGGIITAKTRPSWRSFFYLCAIGEALASGVAVVIIPKDKKKVRDLHQRLCIDWFGGILVITGLTLLLFSLGTSSKMGWRNVWVLLPFGISLVLIVAFVLWQMHLEKGIYNQTKAGAETSSAAARLTQPLMTIDLLTRERCRLLVLLITASLVWSSFVVSNYLFQQYFQTYLRMNMIQTSLRFIPMILLGLASTLLLGFLTHKVPAQLLIMLGCLGTATSCLLAALMHPSASYWQYNFASVALSVVGPDVVLVTGITYGSQIASESEQALAAGIFQTFTQLGGAIGLSIATYVQIKVTKSKSLEMGKISGDDLTLAPNEAFLEGLKAGFWECFFSVSMGFLICVLFLRKIGYVGKRNIPEKN